MSLFGHCRLTGPIILVSDRLPSFSFCVLSIRSIPFPMQPGTSFLICSE
jgi:hypothetical protein